MTTLILLLALVVILSLRVKRCTLWPPKIDFWETFRFTIRYRPVQRVRKDSGERAMLPRSQQLGSQSFRK
jgi:hypothetical protein